MGRSPARDQGDPLELRGRLFGGMPSQEAIRAAFALFDRDGDGLLSSDELKAIMCKKVPGGAQYTEAEVDVPSCDSSTRTRGQ